MFNNCLVNTLYLHAIKYAQMFSEKINQFPPKEKADWKKVFVKETGSETIDALGFVIDGIVYDPYYTFDETEEIRGILPKVSEKIHFGQIFDFRNGKTPVAELKSSLNHDFDAPVFLIDKTTDVSNFNEVSMEYIFPRFHLNDNESLEVIDQLAKSYDCLLYTSPSPRDRTRSRMPSSA